MRVAVEQLGDARVADVLQAAIDAGALTDYAAFDVRVDTRSYHAIVSRDDIGVDYDAPDWRWHVSVSGEHDVPRWRDLVAIVHELRPGVAFAVGIPPRSHWMSLHPHCLHAYELSDANLTSQWRSERMGVEPS